MHQIKSRFSRLLRRSRRHHDDARIYNVVIICRIDADISGKGNSVRNIQCLALRPILISIQKGNLRKQSALHQGKGRGRAHKAAADDGNLAVIRPVGFFSLCCHIRSSSPTIKVCDVQIS